MQSTIIGRNQAGQRLDKFLRKLLPNAGSGFLYKMLRKKNITLNGRKAEGSELLKEGDSVHIFFSQETFEKFSGRAAQAEKPHGAFQGAESAGKRHGSQGAESAEAGLLRNPAVNMLEYDKAYRRLKGIQVIYEDENFLFLDKPAGILSQKADPGDSSLNEWLIGYLLQKEPSLAAELPTFRPSVCNRLDRNTSGIVLCGKTLAGLQFLNRYIRERRVRKFYHTICAGELNETAQIQGYLYKDERNNRVHISGEAGTAPGRESINYIQTRYAPLGVSCGYTFLEVELITGKPHQIRAHLAGTGHPLIGDFKYGTDRVNRRMRREFDLHHQLLHACRVVFPKIPSGVGAALSGREFTAPDPELFVIIRTALGL